MSTFDISQTARVPFARLVAVEMRKAVDTVASFWLVASIVILTVIIDGFVLLVTVIQSSAVALGDFAYLSLLVTSLLLPILGIMLVTSEWGQHTAMVTFSLEPRRTRVIWAKLTVGVALTLATVVIAIVVGVLCTLVCEIASPDQTTWDLAARELTGYLITQTLAMLGGFALATLLLNTPATIVLYFVYRFALPGVLFVVSDLVDAFGKVSPYLNFSEAQGPLFDLTLNTGEEWAQLLVSGLIWLVLPLTLGIMRILRAEVK